MLKERTNYLVGITQDAIGAIYVDVRAGDLRRVLEHARWGNLVCTSSEVGSNQCRVFFPRGTDFGYAQAVMLRFDELYGPGV